jgi:hypothetical protein
MNRRSKMKKLIAALLLTTASTAALAGGHGGGYGGGYRGGYNHYENHYHGGGFGGGGWVAPALIGGIIGYGMAQPRYYPEPTVIYQQPPVVYQQSPSVNYQRCTSWIETVDQYGVTTRTRTCY